MKETARVDKNGRLPSDPDFDKVSGLKTYTSRMTIPIDICLTKVPKDYFAWIRKRLEALRHIKQSGKPGPQPGPDPVRELSEWHSFLEKNSSVLNIYVRELRRITDKPSLTPKQVLAQLGAAVAILARPEIPKSPGEYERSSGENS